MRLTGTLVVCTLLLPTGIARGQALGESAAWHELERGDTSGAAVRHARLGLAELRAGRDSAERAHLDAALLHFCHASQARAGWWLPWYGIGEAQAELSHEGFPVVPSPCHTEGTSYLQDAGFAFARALEAQPSAVPAALALVEALKADRRWGLAGVARTALRRFGASGAEQPAEVLLVRALLERDGGERDSALPLTRGYLAKGGDSGVGLLEVSRELFRLADSGAAASYWAGVAHANSPRARTLLRTQLAVIARPGELAPWDTLSDTARPGWVRAFWTRREIEDGLESGQRLVEHFRRLEVAARGFRYVGFGMAGDTVTASYRASQALLNPPLIPDGTADQVEVDDSMDLSRLWGEQSLLAGPESRSEAGFDGRGQMYLRHGPPQDMAGPFWLYRVNGREYVVAVDRSEFGSACNLSARYCGYELRRRRPPPEVRRGWINEWREMFSELRSFDSRNRHFPHDLPVAARMYAFPRSGELDAGLVVALAVPAAKLTPERTGAGQVYRLHLRLVVGPHDGSSRFDLDTVRTFVLPSGAGANAWIQAMESVPLAPGRYLARLVLTAADSTRGVVLAADSLQLGDASTGLASSDLVFSRATSTLTLRRGGQPIRLDPAGSIGRRDTLQLYHEVGGLTAGTTYRSTIEVLRVSGTRERAELTLSFTDRAEASLARVRREFGLGHLAAGNYIVQVTVVADGQQIVRRAPLTLTD